uniref:hypothetical protein n=1 Tax=Neptunomonas sp. TaxID=1971898 RepID=UPI0035682B4A
EVTVTDDEGGTTSQTVSIMLANVQDEVLTTIVPVSPTPEAVTPAPKPTDSATEETDSSESDETEVIDISSDDQATDNTETDNTETDSIIDANPDDISGLPAPIQANDIFVSVLSDRPTTINSFEDTKPTVEITQTFLQELASFWKDDGLSVMQPDETGRNSPEFINDVNQMLADLDNAADIENKEMKMSAEAITGVSITLTAGFVSWALRAGSLVASFLAVMPAWRHLDPMPILAADEKSRRKLSPLEGDDDFDEILDEDTEKTVDDLFDR